MKSLNPLASILAALALVLAALSGPLLGRDAVEAGTTVAVADLPAEARETLALIHRGGPFPYARDGMVFANREGLLPRAARGAYREYTVNTPGRKDRGAKRIIASRGGQFYYTEDHYRSFSRVRE